jgi:hypothetical protein
MAALTRSLLSLTAASGRPTVVKADTPAAMSTSTSTKKPSTPRRAPLVTRANIGTGSSATVAPGIAPASSRLPEMISTNLPNKLIPPPLRPFTHRRSRLCCRSVTTTVRRGETQLKSEDLMTQPLDLVFHLLDIAGMKGLMNFLHNIIKIERFLDNGGAGQVHGLKEKLPAIDHENGLEVGVFLQALLQELPRLGEMPIGNEEVEDGLFQQLHGLLNGFGHGAFKTDEFNDGGEKIAGQFILIDDEDPSFFLIQTVILVRIHQC